MTIEEIEEKYRRMLESGEFVPPKELACDLANELAKLTKKIKELDLFMADNDVPYIQRKAIKEYFQN